MLVTVRFLDNISGYHTGQFAVLDDVTHAIFLRALLNGQEAQVVAPLDWEPPPEWAALDVPVANYLLNASDVAFSSFGALSSSDVQAALVELDAEKGSFTGDDAVTIGTGTAIPLSAFAAASRRLEVLDGSDATPVTTVGPAVRISRVGSYVGTTGGGSKLSNEKNAALVCLTTEEGDDATGTDMQACGIFVYAACTTAGPWDAVGINCVGRSLGPNTRRGTGAYFEGRKDNTTGTIGGIEVRTNNQAPSNVAGDSTYLISGACNTFGMLVSAQSDAAANPTLGAGLQFTSADATGKWGVGIGFTTTAILTNDIRSDSNATTSILINGTHTTAAIATGLSSGGVGLGITSPQAARLHANANVSLSPTGLPSDAVVFISDPQGMAADRGGNIGLGGWIDLAATTMRSYGHIAGKKSNATDSNSTGYLRLSAHLNATGLVEFLRIDGTAGITIGKTTSQLVGFYNHAGAAQATVTGSRGGNAALASLLTALAAVGLVVDSSSA